MIAFISCYNYFPHLLQMHPKCVENGKILEGKQLEKIAVSASVVKQTRGPKIITLKHRRRKNSTK